MQVRGGGYEVTMPADDIPRSNPHAHTFRTTLAQAIAVGPQRGGVGLDAGAALPAQGAQFGAWQ